MNGITDSSSSSPSQQSSAAVASVTPSVAAPSASVSDLPLIAASNTSSPAPSQQTHSQISTPPQTPTLVPSQRPSVIVTLPNQIPVVTTPTNPIVFAAAPSGSIMVPSSALAGNAPVSITTVLNFSSGSAVTVAMDNISKPSGTILTAATPVVSVSSTPVIQSVTSLAASSSTAISSQPSRHESPQQQIHQSQQLQIPALKSKSLQEIMKEVDPYLQLDEESEEVIRAVAEEFLECVAKKSFKIASHRGSVLVEPRDVKHILEHHWDMTIPGFPTSQEKAVKRPFITQAHRQHLALLQKQVKRS
nr:Transcription initiation factor TFIID subunit [Hymenolepis microstoma]